MGACFSSGITPTTTVSVRWSFHRWSKWCSENAMPPPGHRASECQTKRLTQDDIFLKPIFTSLGNSELLSVVKQRSDKNALCLICCPHIGSKQLCFMFICALQHCQEVVREWRSSNFREGQKGSETLRGSSNVTQLISSRERCFSAQQMLSLWEIKLMFMFSKIHLYSHNRPIKCFYSAKQILWISAKWCLAKSTVD